ncbi:MAG TPA: alcohol dehydrogenase catalytic domain-containing protein [Polyangiaceae bacterium]|nr:alcohol dehydrogenase catalytic domain-containing protein [Polyangiaceae bacterium]
MYGAGDVRVENVPDPSILQPTDAIIRVIRACICGTDLWLYRDMPGSETGVSMGHEAIGIVEAIGRDVRTLERGQVVVMPYASSDGTCEFCKEGLPTACVNLGIMSYQGLNGAQAEALRIPWADGTLYPLDVDTDDARMTSLLTLSDVMGTGHHAAVVARVAPGRRVVVVGDGAVGLCGVIAAKRLGAEQIIMVGRHPDRLALARELGATDIVSERGAEGVERVRELTRGYGAHSVLECVGTREATLLAIEVARPGGAVGRVGLPHYEAIPGAEQTFWKNVTVGGGVAPVRAYIDELLPDILEGRIEPGRVFDRAVGLDGVPDGYRAMNTRESIKVLVSP